MDSCNFKLRNIYVGKLFFFQNTNMTIDASSLGLPPRKLEGWFDQRKFTEILPNRVISEKPLKNLEIPLLNNYRENPGSLFWEKFPHFPLPNPDDYNSPINFEKLKENYIRVKSRMGLEEIEMMDRTLENLTFGADNYVNESLLPGIA